MGRRTGLLAVAVAVAVFGALAVFTYVNRAEARAVTGQQMVDVLTAAARIPQGTTAAAAVNGKLVRVSSLPRKSVPEGALTSLKGLDSQSAVNDIYPGEVLLAAKFADQSARTGQLLIPDDKIAVTVQLGDPQRVAGFVVPGSEIAIFNTSGGSGGANAAKATRLLLPRVTVIAVGPVTLRADEQSGKQANGGQAVSTALVTLAVSQQDAEKVIQATQTGSLYFGLLSEKSKVASDGGVTDSTLYSEGPAR